VIENADNNKFGTNIPMFKRDFTLVFDVEVLSNSGATGQLVDTNTNHSVAATLATELNIVILPHLPDNRGRTGLGPLNASRSRQAVLPTDAHDSLNAFTLMCWQHVLENQHLRHSTLKVLIKLPSRCSNPQRKRQA
jgi:hypothetical protein